MAPGPLRSAMPDITADDAALRDLLRRPRIAVVGASDRPERDSHRIFVYLKEHGYEVVPVNPVAATVAGVDCAADLAAAKKRLGTIDIVDVFRAPEHVPEVVREAEAVGAGALWLQFGVVHHDGIEEALRAGMDVVVDRCIKIEHARLMPA